jgi:hypothetical protein
MFEIALLKAVVRSDGDRVMSGTKKCKEWELNDRIEYMFEMAW